MTPAQRRIAAANRLDADRNSRAIAEQWRPIPDWEGYYEVSDQGRVRSVTRVIESRPGVSIKRRGKVLATFQNNHGYLWIGLYRNSRRFQRFIHALVLEAFVGPRPDGMVIRHLDGEQTNNALTNLRYGTVTENNRDIVRHGRHPKASRTHCKWGHPYTPENTAMKGGGRDCLTCRRANNRRVSDRRKAARAARRAAA